MKILFPLLAFLVFALFSNGEAVAQKRLTLKTTPPDFQKFYADFKNAVVNRDRDRVISMTAFPLNVGGPADAPYTTSKEVFVSEFDHVSFEDNLGGITLFAQTNPVVFEFGSGTYCLVNRIEEDVSHLIFKKVDTGYQFTSLLDHVNVRLQASLPEFKAFYAKFSSAMLRRDKTGVAAMTKFPFKYAYDAGDEGTYTRQQFLKSFGFGGHDAFKQKDPELSFHNGSYNLSTDDASHYIFEWDGKDYKFIQFLAEP